MVFMKLFLIVIYFSSALLVNGANLKGFLPKRSGKIAGGTPPSRNEFLYKCAIYLYSLSSDTNFCSGSIVSENFVLTAAHCFSNITSGTILAGVHDLESEEAEYEWDFLRKHVIVHENFVAQDFINDVALIDTSSNPFKFSPKIQRIKVAPTGLNLTGFVGKTVKVAGWGLTSDSNQEMSNVLLYFNPLVLDSDVCRTLYGGTKVTSNSVCLDASDGRSTCKGDSGGGLEVEIQREIYLIGVVSFGLRDGCQKKSPTVSTFLPPFANWINSKIIIGGS